MRVGFDFQVRHKNKKYLITVNHWCKDSDFDSTYFIIDPTMNTIVEKHWLDGNVDFIDLVKSLE